MQDIAAHDIAPSVIQLTTPLLPASSQGLEVKAPSPASRDLLALELVVVGGGSTSPLFA